MNKSCCVFLAGLHYPLIFFKAFCCYKKPYQTNKIRCHFEKQSVTKWEMHMNPMSLKCVDLNFALDERIVCAMHTVHYSFSIQIFS